MLLKLAFFRQRRQSLYGISCYAATMNKDPSTADKNSFEQVRTWPSSRVGTHALRQIELLQVRGPNIISFGQTGFFIQA